MHSAIARAILIRTVAATLTAVILGIAVNLVSNYFVLTANKKRRLTISALAALVILTVILTVVTDEQLARLRAMFTASVASVLATKYGWTLILVAAICIVTVLFWLGRGTLRSMSSSDVDLQEVAYLRGLIADVGVLNGTYWKEEYFVDTEAEVVSENQFDRVRPSYYLVQKLNVGVRDSDFENLPNAEKVENSRGVSYGSFAKAAHRATDNAVVVLAAPGAGKTVTLRRLAREYAQSRLRNGASTPLFVNLAYYTTWQSEGRIEPFEEFLESYFATGYKSWLTDGKWQDLLRQGRCIFVLDGIDEIPRAADEYLSRIKEVERFVRSWPDTKFYLSCRELDYDYRLGFQQILIKPFDLRRVKKFVKLRFKDRPDLHALAAQAWQNSSLSQLAKVPFYLNLICGYIRGNGRIPTNKSELFSFVVDQVVNREVERRGKREPTSLVNQVFDVHCKLAAAMSLDTMSRTLSLDSRVGQSILVNRAAIPVIELGIRGGLLELDRDSHTIRFTHHRFQEFFCAVHLAEQYPVIRMNLPPDFFVNIWWRETLLMIASVAPEPASFIRLMLSSGEEYRNDSTLVESAIKLDVRALAHECLLSNDSTKKSTLTSETRADLISRFPAQSPLGKVRILESVAEDSSREAMQLLIAAEKDRSTWVSEKAFFIRSAGTLRFRPTLWGATKEFSRFLLSGRIFANASSVLALATRFPGMRWLIPLYVIFAFIGMGTVAVLALVTMAVGKFLVFDLHYAFSAQCLRCLINVAMMAAILAFLLTRQRPWLQRFLVAAPTALICWFLVFNIPESLLIRAPAVLLGYGLGAVLDRWSRTARRVDSRLQSIEAYVIGIVIGFFLVAVVSKFIVGDVALAQGPSIPDASVPVLLVILLVFIVLFGWIVVSDLLVIKLLRESREEVSALIAGHRVSYELIPALAEMFNRLKAHSWAQRILLHHVLAQISDETKLSDATRLEFLFRLGDSVPSSRFRDILYQRCDELEANFRRSLGRQADQALPAE